MVVGNCDEPTCIRWSSVVEDNVTLLTSSYIIRKHDCNFILGWRVETASMDALVDRSVRINRQVDIPYFVLEIVLHILLDPHE